MDGSLCKKKPVHSYELFLKYGGEGGIDSLCSPFGQSPRKLVVCPTGCASCRTPVGGSHPPLVWGIPYKQKARTSVQALNLNMAVRGGLTRFARPFGAARSLCARSVQLAAPLLSPSLGLAPSGQPVRCAPGLSNWLRQLSNPGRWFSSPLGLGDTYKQKARTSVQALNLNMAVRGGFEPPIRCRIHTFQACSFSHSDTSPYCIAA